MAAGLVVRACAFHGAVVLRNVEIDRPGTQCMRHLPQRVSQTSCIGPVIVLRKQATLPASYSPACKAWCAPCRPESQASWVDRPSPAARPCASSHASRPSRSRPRRRAARRSLRRCRMPRERSPRCVSCSQPDLLPTRRARWPNQCAPRHICECQDRAAFADRAGFANLGQKTGRAPPADPIAEPPPAGGQTGATNEPATRLCAASLSASRLQVVVGGIDVGVRQRQEQIDAVELCSVHLGRCGEVEHGIEIDRRLGVGTFADDARPHRVVERGVLVCGRCAIAITSFLTSFRRGSASGLPGPKCFRITSGSVDSDSRCAHLPSPPRRSRRAHPR